MPATIFAGSKVKALKSTLNLNGGADVISSATDPTSVAVDAAVGSLLLNSSSGKLYKKLDSGSSTNWQEVGAGTGGKNYITKGTFDTASTSGWSLASSTLDATTKLPNQASGSWGSAAGTLSITTVGGGSQLSLLPYSLSLVSSAATTAGNMLVSDALPLDLEAQASIQTFSFFYKIASGSPTLAGNSTNSIGVAIYDVTNGAWIDPAGRYNITQISGVAKCAGTFQVPSNCTSIRLAVYFPNASAGAITVYLDDFYLGPQVVQYGAPVTDWQDYTPTFAGFGTVSAVSAKYRRVGDSVEVIGRFTAGTTAGTTASISLPSGLSVDTTKLITNNAATLGLFTRAVSAATGYPSTSIGPWVVFHASSTGANVLSIGQQVQASGGGQYSAATGSALLNTGDYGSFEFRVPVLGWSSSVQMSNDTDTRVVAANYKKTANQAVTGNVTDISFDSRQFDTHGAWTGSAYVAPVPGYYSISGSMNITTATSVNLAAFVNGTARQIVGTIVSGNNVTIGGLVYLEAGQSLSIRSEVNITILGNAATLGPYLAIQRLSGPSQIAASETVAARYTKNGSQVIGSGSVKITSWTKDYDTHGFFDSTNNLIKIPVSGKWAVTFKQSSTRSGGGTIVAVGISKNSGAVYFIGGVPNYSDGTSVCTGSDTISANAGDTIEFYIYTNAGATVSVDCYFAVNRVGN